MDNLISFGSIESRIQADPSKINDTYDLIVKNGVENYVSKEDFDKSFEYIIKRYIDFNDYLHSNNLLQLFNSLWIKGKNYTIPVWYKYYRLKVISKRTIKYFLDNPQEFWDNIYDISSSMDDYTQQLDSLIVDTLDFYKSKFAMYPDFLYRSMNNFIHYYYSHKKYSTTVTAHIDEIKCIIGNDKTKVAENYKRITEKIEFSKDDNPSDVYSEKKDEDAKKLQDELYGDIKCYQNDRNKYILIIGADPFLQSQYPKFIAKEFGFSINQLKIINDYNEIVNNAVKSLPPQHQVGDKQKCMGIILGSMPHKISYLGDYSSLVSKLTQETGWPFTYVCRANNVSRTLKITNSNFRVALRQILLNWHSK